VKNLKTTMIAALLMLTAVGGVVAQEKYEYAVVQYIYLAPRNYITVSINGETYEEIELDKNSSKSRFFGWDLNPVLKKVNEMEDKGWERYDQQASFYGVLTHAFYFRKKRP
jgi:hypothetical protein